MSALRGKRIVITRAPHQAGELAAMLEARGAIPLFYPCIDIAPPADTTLLDTAVREAAIGAYDWLVLTSANTVIALASRLAALGMNGSTLQVRVAAVGPATAEAARERLGLQTDMMPETYVAEALAKVIQPIDGAQVLLPQSAIAETTLADELRASGAQVTTIDAYRTVEGSGGVDLPALLASSEVDVITFTSGSTVKNLLYRLEREGGNARLLNNVCIACIGTKTAAVASAHKLQVTVVPAEYTLEGLTTALEHYFSGVKHVD